MRALLWVLGICGMLFVLLWFVQDTIIIWTLPDKVLVTAQGNVELNDVEIKCIKPTAQDTVVIYANGKQQTHSFRLHDEAYFLVYERNNLLGMFEWEDKSQSLGKKYHFYIGGKEDSIWMDMRVTVIR